MTIQTKITTAIATGAVLAQVLSPLALADSTITGNGALSNNVVNSSTSNTTVVNQNNNASISNVVSSNSSTGGNTSDFNTNGNTTIVTGAAANNTQIVNNANLNVAHVAPCGSCGAQGGDITITGNGAASNNTVNSAVNANRNSSDINVAQNNNANVSNGISGNANTGNNSASHSTGGNVTVVTGNAVSNVAVANNLNKNQASVGGATVGANASAGDLTITGNGALSQNVINSERDSAIVLAQNNTASVSNIVSANAKTGGNAADFNTGGMTAIATGMAQAQTIVDNAVNMNMANVDCSCLLGNAGLNKIGGNGAASLNVLNTNSSNANFANQNGVAGLFNGVGANSDTGSNGASFGTGHILGGDPVILTGGASNMTSVYTSSNANVYGTSPISGLSFNFDMSPLFGLFW